MTFLLLGTTLALLTAFLFTRVWPRLQRTLIRTESLPDGVREFAAATLGQGGVLKMLLYCSLLPVVDRRLPRPIVTWLCRRIGTQQGIDFSELGQPLETYPTLGAFFVRALDPARRPICQEINAIISPADCEVVAQGRLTPDAQLIVKGMPYRLADLLPLPEADRFLSGDYLVLYLRPSDCHRIFSPIDDAHVRTAVAFAGGGMPVAPVVQQLVPGVYVQNKRLAQLLSSSAGEIALVMVGAFKVGRMETTYDSRPWSALHAAAPATDRRDYQPPPQLARAAWLATFHLGSSIILLFEPGRFLPDAGLLNRRLRYGERIGAFRPAG